MGIGLTVRDIDPGDKSWLRRESRQLGVSMEELVRTVDPRADAWSVGLFAAVCRRLFEPDG
ncbi:MAG: hypothetical protein OXI15_21750 [Chromatiales bacterium]|nr:hypothetical protein [Chromatiales bacterium]